MPREVKDHRGFPTVGNGLVLEEVGFKAIEDGRASGFLVFDEKDVGGWDVKVQEVLLERFRVIDGSLKRRQVVLRDILVSIYELQTAYIQKKVTDIINTDDERKDSVFPSGRRYWAHLGCWRHFGF